MKKQIFTLLALLLTVCSGAWAENATATIDFGNAGYTSLVGITFSDGTNTTGSLVDATLGGSATKAYSSAYSQKGLSTTFTTSSSYSNISGISFYVSTTDKGKTYLTVEVSPNADFSSSVTTVQAEAVMNGGGLPTNVGNNNQYYQETYSLSPSVSGYVRIKVSEGSGSSGKTINVGKIEISYVASSEAHTVTFNAGSNGTCETASLTEASAGAGVTLPAVTPNSGYVFNGWYDAASEGTKVGDAGDIYNPVANITLYAQYSAQSAPGISIDNYNPSTKRGIAVTFTATATGAPVPTVTWYQSATAVTSGGTEKGTGTTYNPDVATEGTFYYYAVASNGISPDATSELITLTVTNPNIDCTGYNTYYVVKNETAVGDEQVLCDDITMVYDNVTYNKGGDDQMIKSLNPKYVASIGSGTNGWGVTFTPSVDGVLSVGVVINGGKKFSITNATSFSYVDNEGNSGTIESNEWTPNNKEYTIITLAVEAGTSYKFSVAGSKMSLYGFEFNHTTLAITPAKTYTTYITPAALDFTGLELKAYVATTASASAVNMEPVTTVPANTPLVLKKGSAASYDVPVIVYASAPATNLLKAGDGTTNVGGDGVYDYILSNGMFYHASPAGPVAVGKAYLHLDSAPTGARELSLSFEDNETTGIDATLVNSEKVNSEVFNLAGQRVAQPTRGLYIVNGKKVLLP